MPNVPASQPAKTNRNTVERVLVNVLRNAVEAVEVDAESTTEGEINVTLAFADVEQTHIDRQGQRRRHPEGDPG